MINERLYLDRFDALIHQVMQCRINKHSISTQGLESVLEDMWRLATGEKTCLREFKLSTSDIGFRITEAEPVHRALLDSPEKLGEAAGGIEASKKSGGQ